MNHPPAFDSGDQVRIFEPHPFAGHTGTVITYTIIRSAEGHDEDGYVVLLANGDRVRACANMLQPAQDGAR